MLNHNLPVRVAIYLVGWSGRQSSPAGRKFAAEHIVDDRTDE